MEWEWKKAVESEKTTWLTLMYLATIYKDL